MERYFVKAPVSGWHEVDREHFERFVENIRKNANPPTMTKEELIKSITKTITGRGNPPTT